MRSLLVIPSSSPGFGRLGSLFFPEICSTSVPGSCGEKPSNRRLKVCGRQSLGCSAISSSSGSFDYPLSQDANSDNSLLAEIRKRKKDLAASFFGENAADASVSWKKVSGRELTNKIMELSKKRQLNEVFELIESAKAMDKKLNRKTMNAVLEACVHCRNIYRAMQVFNGMAEAGACGVDEVTYGSLIKGLGQAGMLDKAFEIIELLEGGRAPGDVKLSVIHLNTLINACATAGDAKRARAALIRYRSVVKDKGGPSLVTYNMLVKGYARSDNPLEALKVREEMVLRGVQPNKLTLNSLILAGVRGHEIDMAFEILEEMKEAGKVNADMAPDVVTYTILLKALAEDGDIESVLKIVAEMRATETCVLDRVGYTSIIDACIRAGSPADGMCFFLEMQELAKQDCQLKPRAHAFLALIRAFAETGDVPAVLSLQSKMISEASGHVWPEDILEANELLIEAAVNCGQLNVAKTVLTDILKPEQPPQLSQRGYLAVVRLETMTGFANTKLSPWLIKDEDVLDATVASIIPHLTTLEPLSAARRVSEVASSFTSQSVFPVVDDDCGKCIGTVHVEDCNQVDVPLTEVMRAPPATLPSNWPFSAAVKALLEPGVKTVAIVDSLENGTISYYLAKDNVIRHLSGCETC